MPVDDTQPVHSFFGLTYANYLVLPRSVMQSMPVGWQQDMVKLLEEAGERFGEYYAANDYDVRLVKRDEDGEVVEVHSDPLADYRHQKLKDQKELEAKRAKLTTELDYGDL